MATEFLRKTLTSFCLAIVIASVAACTSRPPGPGNQDNVELEEYAGSRWVRQSAIDPGINACENFYRHACGRWIASTPVNESKPVVHMAREQFSTKLDQAMQQLFASNTATKNAELERLRTFHSSCLASANGSNAGDLATTRQWLSRIDAAKSASEIQALLLALHQSGVGAFFDYSGRPDRSNWSRYRGEIHQSRLWADAKVVEKTFILSGSSNSATRRATDAVVSITNTLRKYQVDRSDPTIAENPRSIKQLGEIAPQINWREYFDLVGASDTDIVNVTSPKYLAAVGKLLVDTAPRDLQAYLRWSFLFSLRGELPSPYPQAFGDIQPNLRVALNDPNKRCHEATLRAMGVEFSRQFSNNVLGWDARLAGQRIAESIRNDVVKSVSERPWLSKEARAATAEKLSKTDLKIGYPDEWPEVGTYPLRQDRFLDNVLAARVFEQQRAWSRAKRARNRQAWEMYVYPWEGEGMAAARLVVPNGFPDVFSNSIIMTSAFLMPPTFDPTAPIEVNYASFGSTLAHELIHVAELHMIGPDGRDAELWTKVDEKNSQEQKACVVEQASNYRVFQRGMDGESQAPENLADYGGVRLAYEALAKKMGSELHQTNAGGMSASQRYFYVYAQQFCTAETEESLRKSVEVDRHAPAEFRVNAPLSNLSAFAEAFSCTPSNQMVRTASKQCNVW